MKICKVTAIAAAVCLSTMVPALHAQPVPSEQQRRDDDQDRDQQRNKGPQDKGQDKGPQDKGQDKGPDNKGPDKGSGHSQPQNDSGRGPKSEGRNEPQGRSGNARPNNDSHDRDDRRSDNSRQRPPSDFSDVRRIIKENRGSIGRGGAVPSHVHIVKGKPMPAGWGKRLTEEQLRPLPRYPGYEWRRLGGDMILVEVSTAIVVEILSGVLD